MSAAAVFPHSTGRTSSDGLRRVMAVSLAIHVGAVLVMFALPRDWLNSRPVPTRTMTISLGAAGPRTAGLNPAGARPVEQVAPPPSRPETARPVTPQSAPAVAAVKTTKPPAKTAPAEPTPAPAPARAPVTGAQVTPGTARAETGAQGPGTGLAGGAAGGGAQAETPVNFCCPEYVTEMQRRITERWKNLQPERGLVILTFTIRRDGTFTDLKTERADSPLLEYHARNSFNGLLLPRLPAEYTEETLKVRLTFPYVR